MKTTAYKITCTRETDSNFGDDREVYYEPEKLPRQNLDNLLAAGWRVREQKISIRDEIARLTGTGKNNSRQAAALAGASSMTHAYDMAAGLAEQAVSQLRRIANGGPGTLLD